MSEQRTVRVRIAVAVDTHGQWAAYASDNVVASGSERKVKRELGLAAGDEFLLSWIEADVPLPAPPAVIEGVVSPAEEEVSCPCIDCGYEPCECEVGYGLSYDEEEDNDGH